MKNCKKCHVPKPLSDYYSAKGCKDGTWHTCKACTLEKQIKYNNSRKEIRKEQAAKRYLENKDIILAKNKIWHKNNPEKTRAYVKKHKSSEKGIKSVTEYRVKNKDKLQSAANKREKERLKNDPLFKMRKYLRSRTKQCFRQRGLRKNCRTEDVLGVTFEIAKIYIQKQFKKGMNWDNYGKWHIDHVIPLATGKTENELKELCHYTNLQPLWAKENMSKGKKIIKPIQTKILL